MVGRIFLRAALAAFALIAILGVAAHQQPANARVFIGFGFGPCCGYYDPYWYYPPPYYYGYYGPPVMYGPPPTEFAPARGYSGAPELNTDMPMNAGPANTGPMNGGPPPRAMRQPPRAVWYYCENPAGYYPYVKKCGSKWREVAAQPEQ